MRRLWRDHSLTIVVTPVALLVLALSLWSGWTRFVAEQSDHGAGATLAAFVPYWAHDVLSEFLGEITVGVLALVWLTKQFREHGSPESGDQQ
jgi:multisubunit Na+/H+ antiporter MnhB subunit